MHRRSLAPVALFAAFVAWPAVAAPQSESAPPPESATQSHKTLDSNGDGAIDRNEAAQKPKFADKFDQYDKNGDGRITAEERPQRHGKDKRGHLAEMDADGDGKLSQAEAAQKPKLAERFAAIDSNGDGFLVREEMQAYRQKMRPQRDAQPTPQN